MFEGISNKINEIKTPLMTARDEARDLLIQDKEKYRGSVPSNLLGFFANIPRVWKLIWEEPEIIFLLMMQWLVIVLAYLIWIQILHWIPDSVWQAIAKADKDDRDMAFHLLDLLFFVWSTAIILIAAYPLSLFNAAIVTVHNLRTCGKESTLINSLAIANKHIGKIWLFTFVDAYITVSAILDRLPRKRNNRTVMDEILYYAWKLATIAIIPALLNGRGFMDAGKDSLTLIKDHPTRAVGLRFGYSAVCWIVGIVSYAAAVLTIHFFPQVTHASIATSSGIYFVYYVLVIPLLISIGVIVVLVRPFYLLGVAEFYSDNIEIQKEIDCDVNALPSYRHALFNWYTILFLVLLLQVLLLVFFGEQLGWVKWIQHLAAKDLAAP